MSWVRQAKLPEHVCDKPMREVWFKIPPPPPPPNAGKDWKPGPWTSHRGEDWPNGNQNDVWRCDDCGKLWRIGLRCDVCDYYGDHSTGGSCVVGNEWRPARLGQRIRHWRSR